MVWYQYLDRTTPYIKNFRRWNLWYDYSNPKHHDIRRMKVPFFEHFFRRFTKHDSYARYFHVFVTLPFLVYLNGIRKRYTVPKVIEDDNFYSGAQFIAAIGRNQYGYETRVTKSFEHALSILLGKEILGHILSQDFDPFRQEHLADFDSGLAGDMSEEDILDLMKDDSKHPPHLGIVYRNPQLHYLNDKPSDILSCYKIVGEKPVNNIHDHASHSAHH